MVARLIAQGGDAFDSQLPGTDTRHEGEDVSTRRTVTACATAAASLMAAFAFSSPAHAATTKFCNAPFAKAGGVCFYSDGDDITVTDNYADGLRSVARWWVEDRDHGNRIVDSGECHNANGKGTTVTCDYDFPEGKNMIIVFSAAAREGADGKDQYSDDTVTIGWVSGR